MVAGVSWLDSSSLVSDICRPMAATDAAPVTELRRFYLPTRSALFLLTLPQVNSLLTSLRSWHAAIKTAPLRFVSCKSLERFWRWSWWSSNFYDYVTSNFALLNVFYLALFTKMARSGRSPDAGSLLTVQERRNGSNNESCCSTGSM